MAIPDSGVQRAYRIRVPLFLLAAGLTLAVSIIGYQGLQTLRVLDLVEHDRDRWQQAGDVIGQLNLKEGNVVADVGSGAGYFALKLAPVVGEKGGVLAVDIRREPSVFLWLRARIRHEGNVHLIHAEPDNPHLPRAQVDAVLIANTYHEFADPKAVLSHVFESLRTGGRLVIVDRGPLRAGAESRELAAQHHEAALATAEREVRETGFEEIDRRDPFIEPPNDHPWWLLAARRR